MDTYTHLQIRSKIAHFLAEELNVYSKLTHAEATKREYLEEQSLPQRIFELTNQIAEIVEETESGI